MAAFDHFSNMYDVALKPRLLRSLIKEHLPDEKHPFENPSDISMVVSLIKTHSLLSESITESMEPKQIESWKSAVKSWVDRILALVSSNMPDKCWAGVSLLGVTCQQCSSDRFLESYAGWFQKLLSFLQYSKKGNVFELSKNPELSMSSEMADNDSEGANVLIKQGSQPRGNVLGPQDHWDFELIACAIAMSPADSHFLRVASCASMSDLFARLSGFANFKRDGSSCAVKVIQPVLKLLSDDNSEAIWEGALHLLCTIITSFPFSIHRHYDSVEYAIASKLLSGGCSLNMLKKLAHCLALLPKSRGDEESWSVMMQKILVVINDQLNNAFQGLEEETKRNEVSRLLVLPGKDPPPQLGGYILAEEASNKATKRSEQSLMSNVSRLSTLMFGCCMMLTNSYPVKVNVPVRLLLALVERILMVNGSLPQMSLPFMTAKQQENICSELPVLHLCSLDLVCAIIRAMGSQLLPHAASIVHIITKYFKTCALPELRIKVYSVTRSLLMSMGVGMALCLAQEVINNALVDLNPIGNKSGGKLNGANSNASAGTLLQPSGRKRKHNSTTSSLQEHDEVSGLGVEVPKIDPLTPIALRIAALEALEALITVAGALRSAEQWRSKVDNLLMVIAMDSFKEALFSEEISFFQRNEPAATAIDLQLAALRALLPSFLSCAQMRPPYLAQGLELFRRGKQQTGTKLAELCAHALLALEVLIHPRALPLGDYSHANHSSFGEAHCNFRDDYVVGQNNSTPFGLQHAGHDTPDSGDDLCGRWLESGKEADASLAEDTKYAVELSGDNDPKVLSVHLSSGTKIQERSELVCEVATCADVEMRVVEDEIIFKSNKPGESVVQNQESISCASIPVAEAHGSVGTEIVSETERIVSDSTVPHHKGSQMESGQGTSVNKGLELASPSNSLLPRTSDSDKSKEFAFKLDHEYPPADEDAFPDIVDADPDSDYE